MGEYGKSQLITLNEKNPLNVEGFLHTKTNPLITQEGYYKEAAQETAGQIIREVAELAKVPLSAKQRFKNIFNKVVESIDKFFSPKDKESSKEFYKNNALGKDFTKIAADKMKKALDQKPASALPTPRSAESVKKSKQAGKGR